MDGAQQLRYTMTSQDYVNGYAVAFETADFGRRMIRNFRIGAGSVFAGVAALAWFMVDDPVLARLLAGVYLVMGALFVVFGKPIATRSYRRRLAKVAQREGLGATTGLHLATITDHGLHEESDGTSVTVEWGQFERIIETDHLYILSVANLRYFMIPKQPDPAATSDFIAAVRTRVPLLGPET